MPEEQTWRGADRVDVQLDVIEAMIQPVSYTHLRAHETVLDLVCRLLLEKKNQYTIFDLTRQNQIILITCDQSLWTLRTTTDPI